MQSFDLFQTLRNYQEKLEEYQREVKQSEQTSSAALSTDYDFLYGEIQRTRQRITEESQQLESNVQLDLNLERKRKTDLTKEMEVRAKSASNYLDSREIEIKSSLESVSKQAMTAIGSTAGAILLAFLGYKLFSE